MAAVPTPIESGDVFLDQITKEDVREYFLKMDCSLRVLGSQFGLEPSKLSDLEYQAAQDPMNLRLLLLDECFKQEKIKSWLQFVTVLEKPALDQRTIAGEIRRRFNSVSRQISMDSATRQISMDSATSSVSINTATTPMSPLSSMEVSGSFSSSLGIKTGSKSLRLLGTFHMCQVAIINTRNAMYVHVTLSNLIFLAHFSVLSYLVYISPAAV